MEYLSSRPQRKSWIQRILWPFALIRIDYLLFLILIMGKLIYLHSNLHVQNIDMNTLDKVTALGSVLLASFWTLWLPRRGRIAALIILDVLLSFLMFADLVYFRYFQDFITIPVLMQAGQVESLGGSIRELIHTSDIWLFADWIVLLGAAIYLLVRRIQRRNSYRSQAYTAGGTNYSSSRGRRVITRLIQGAVIFALGWVLTFAPIKYATSTWAVGLFVGNWWNMSLYNVTGLLGFHGYDVYRYAQDHWGNGNQLSAQATDEVKDWFDEKQKNRAQKGDDALFGAYKGSNVIAIQGEAFMNFVIGKKFNGQEITPNINRLMKSSMYYSQYYHQTGQGRTSDADMASNASLHPLPTGSVFTRYADHEYDTLPQILKKQGYGSYVFHAYEPSFWNRSVMYQNMGYDHFYSKDDFTIDEPLGWSLGDKSFFRQSVEKMSAEKQPFYSFLITLSSHHPFTLPASVQELDMGDLTGTTFGDYIQSLHYVDAALGEMEQDMKKAGLWDNTILLFYGDHDDSLKDKAPMEEFLGKPLTDLDMEQLMNQVPMLIHLPDGKHAGTYDIPAGQLDMTPSILHLLGVEASPYYLMGNDMFDTKEKKLVVLRTGAFTDGKVFYIPSADGIFEHGTAYDMKTREETDVERARDSYDEAQKRLNISDELITHDLIRQFHKEKAAQ
ncbi:LTA synthase family protein [Paenibacillus bovis]|uniref:Phosphoglycerol transferase n=1 Tax=Paenibacillus bovis TaxID=1616788 RepID=A0A172ZFD2_9BACL|nr:LTA synthase family protein [Paenibacillus bovis]ANF96346.1 phosphoglycerol transferase [Paenibacillus bovis]